MDPTEIPLRDLHLPIDIGWWPLAPGWWVLVGLAIAGIVYLLYLGWLRYRRNRPRRVALKQLSGLHWDFEYGADPVTLASELSELTRRAMLAYAPRDKIAGLTGSRWLEWLDRGLDAPLFTEGAGRLLESLPYVDPAEVSEENIDLRGLLDAVKIRLKRPVPGVMV